MGYVFRGIDNGDGAGRSIASVGDINGDGIDDFLIGAFFANIRAGETYLVSGADLVALDNATANGGIAGDGVIELADVAAIGTSYQFEGVSLIDDSGWDISGVGDVTGDGIADLLIGAPFAGVSGGGNMAGQTYLISGADLAALDNTTATGGVAGDGIIRLFDVAAIGTSYQFNGTSADDFSGISVSSAGDLTGDGVGDFLIGASGVDPNGTRGGAVYLVSGADLVALDNATTNGGIAGDGIIELADVAAVGTSYQFNASVFRSSAGSQVTSVGDVTGDGIEDFAIGARYADPNGSDSGQIYLISGADLAALDNATGNGGTAGDGIIELADIASIGTSYVFNGIDGSDNAGWGLSYAGDVTGDGIDDFLIGADSADPNGDNSGEAYLISGADLAALDNATTNGGVANDGIIELADVASVGTSYQFNGANAGDSAGHALSWVGDVTGDGIDDFLIGAHNTDTNGSSSGDAYLISGADLVALDNATANGGVAGDGIINLADVAAIGTSYQFSGSGLNDRAGYAVSSAGDVDNDGVDDLLISAGFDGQGETYLISGASLVSYDNDTGNGGTAGDGIIELANIAGVIPLTIDLGRPAQEVRAALEDVALNGSQWLIAPSRIIVSTPGGNSIWLFGEFTLGTDGGGNTVVTAGTVTSLEINAGGLDNTSITGLNGDAVDFFNGINAGNLTPWFVTQFAGGVLARGSDVADDLSSFSGLFPGDDRVIGGAGDDTAEGGQGNDVLDGGAGARDALDYSGEGGGSAVNVDLTSGTAADTFGDTDTISNFEEVWGTDFNDSIRGDDADNILLGNNGNDTLRGEVGRDTLDGGEGHDRLYGRADRDLLLGGNGEDRLFGGSGRDTLRGGNDDDDLFGGKGRDRLEGGNGADSVDGDGGHDNLFGNAGDDTLVGGAGNDRLTGGNNADTFVFANGFGNDTIVDFSASNNREDIDLSGVSEITDYSDLIANHIDDSSGTVVIDDGSGNTITLNGITSVSQLDSGDFIF